MSTIVCVRDGDAAILSSDSRYVDGWDFRTVVSDAEPKIFEVAPDTFLAVSGRKSACDFQREMGRELSDRLHTVDVVAIAAVLQQVTCAFLGQVVERLRSVPGERTAQILSGAALIHGCVLVGRDAGGQLVAIAQSYRSMGDQVVCFQEVHSGDHRTIVATCGAPLDRVGAAFSFSSDPTIWTDEPESVARRILREVKAATAESGGPDQIVRVDGKGGRWLEKPPAGAGAAIEGLGQANITALVSMTSPTISGGSIVGATVTSTLNGVIAEMNGVFDSSVGGNAGLRVRSSGSPNFRVVVVPGGIWMIDASNVVRAQLFGDGTAKFYRSSGVLSVLIDGPNSQVLMYDTSGNVKLSMDTFSNAGHIDVSGTGAAVRVNGTPLT